MLLADVQYPAFPLSVLTVWHATRGRVRVPGTVLHYSTTGSR